MKKRSYIILFFCLVIIGYFLFRPSEIKKLKCYEERSEGKISLRVYLVDAPPLTIWGLESKMLEELELLKKTNDVGSELILFIKEKDADFGNRLIWGEGDGNYFNCTAVLDNEDFLGSAHFFKTRSGKDTMHLKIYSGPLYYY